MAPPSRRRESRRLTLWILAWLLAAPVVAGDSGAAPAIAPAGNFAADAPLARERRIPILIFYSRSGCRWCEQARRQELIPLGRDPASAGRVLIREVAVDSDAPLIDFAGRATAHGAFAKERGIRMTPTLDFVDDRGNRLAESIVGVGLPDFYGATIERAIDESLARLRKATPANP